MPIFTASNLLSTVTSPFCQVRFISTTSSTEALTQRRVEMENMSHTGINRDMCSYANPERGKVTLPSDDNDRKCQI